LQQEKIIEVHGLTKKFKHLVAVNNLELNVYRGDVFGFLGPNGAGKSTTIRMLLSLIRPTSGSIRIFGRPLNGHRREILLKIGAIVEKPDFYLYLTAYKNLEILAKISGRPVSQRRIWEMLELVKLDKRAHSKVKSFSHGMKQRLGIAQALLHDPELIILDEPTTGLDPQGMKELRDLIIYLSAEQGKTIFLSSHILKEVEDVATRLIIINNGAAQVEGRVDELLSREEFTVTVEVDSAAAALQALQNTPWQQALTAHNDNKLIFKLQRDEIPRLNQMLVHKHINVSALIPRRSLEEFFLKITEERPA